MTAITEKDIANLETLRAIHANKAEAYKKACWNRAQARRQDELTETLKKTLDFLVETAVKEGVK